MAVEKGSTASRPITLFRFRPHGQRRTRWSPLSAWTGPLPKGLNQFFAPYFKHANVARQPIEQRRALGTAKPDWRHRRALA